MPGILVDGDNHFIVEGPEPPLAIARELARHWSVIRIGGETPAHLAAWRILNRAFREELTWAIAVRGAGEPSPAVRILLEELAARGVELREA